MHDQASTIETFLVALAAKQPAPGGGSAAALTGAIAAATGEMVLNYSVGKKGLENAQHQLKAALAEFTRARELFLQLMTEDQLAYEALTAARKSKENFEVALLACIRIPQAMAATALAMLDLCVKLSPIVNRHLLSDLAVAADLAMATLRSALHNVRANLSDIPDEGERDHIAENAEQLLRRGIDLIKKFSMS
jgi:formiminotetrahydrofolate cyclodeaminase